MGGSMEIPMDISTWDDKCMQAFIRENASMFRVFAFRYLQDEEAEDDVLQESYMKLWINRSKIGSVKSPRNYFFSIIKNTIADKRDYFPKGRKALVPADVSDDGLLLRNIIEAQSIRMIGEAIMQLSPQSRQVMQMTLDEMSLADIAAALDVSVNTVKTIKYRALKRLATMLLREDFLLLLLF